MSDCPEYPAHVESLLGVLVHQRTTMADRVVCHRVSRQRSGLVAEPLTVAMLLDRAAHAAGRLAAAGVRAGDRVVVSLSDPHDFLVALVGAMTAGATAVPLPTAGETGAPRSFAERVRSVAADCAPAAALVDDAERFRRVVGELPHGMALLAPSADGVESTAAPTDRPAREAAFIQYTSGSTGTPKGVVVTHANVLANCRAIRDATAYARGDRMVSWLPLHHDMGLVGGLLTSIYCAAETWVMPPMAFLARPVTWLEAIARFRATLTVAPTFAYALCARKLSPKQLDGLDLSSLRLAYVGAEPIDPGTIAAFAARFAPYGLPATAMYPVYGLAEATLAVTFPEPGRALRHDRVDRGRLARERVAAPVAEADPAGVTFVSVGRALPGHRVEVVCPDTRAPLGERRVGELVVEGPSVTPRYFGDDAPPPRTRLPTGDLAYVADGQVYVVDRMKDLVIIAGQSWAPSDIERVVGEVAGLRRGRIVAFSAPDGSGTEALHVVAEASPDGWRPAEELGADVRRRVRRDVGLAVATVTIVAAGTLARTSSGKIKRRACVEAHRDGTLVPAAGRAGALAQRVARRIGRMLPARSAPGR